MPKPKKTRPFYRAYTQLLTIQPPAPAPIHNRRCGEQRAEETGRALTEHIIWYTHSQQPSSQVPTQTYSMTHTHTLTCSSHKLTCSSDYSPTILLHGHTVTLKSCSHHILHMAIQTHLPKNKQKAKKHTCPPQPHFYIYRCACAHMHIHTHQLRSGCCPTHCHVCAY